jgi:hypothetical protein
MFYMICLYVYCVCHVFETTELTTVLFLSGDSFSLHSVRYIKGGHNCSFIVNWTAIPTVATDLDAFRTAAKDISASAILCSFDIQERIPVKAPGVAPYILTVKVGNFLWSALPLNGACTIADGAIYTAYLAQQAEEEYAKAVPAGGLNATVRFTPGQPAPCISQ